MEVVNRRFCYFVGFQVSGSDEGWCPRGLEQGRRDDGGFLLCFRFSCRAGLGWEGGGYLYLFFIQFLCFICCRKVICYCLSNCDLFE